MKITVFTGNQPRHINLVSELSEIAETVYTVQECSTIFPGEVQDNYDATDVMGRYFEKVRSAEEECFGNVSFSKENVRNLSLRKGDLNRCPKEFLKEALDSDYYVVFGASYIKGWLIDFLIERKAVNIHMGVSPYYRGSSCNFWAAYDGHPEMVGATIILLGKGLDSGDILYHALPKAEEIDPFLLGMKAVKVAQASVVERIRSGEILRYEGIKQDKGKEIRYTKNAEFDDTVAEDYLLNRLRPHEVRERIEKRDLSLFDRPYIG